MITSKNMRESALFMRNNFEGRGKWGIPLIRKQEVDTTNVSLIACSDTRSNDVSENRGRGVHFFVDDYRFENIYTHPEKSVEKYAQYAFLLSPDFSTYADMDLWRQMESVAKNRWVGAFWQSKGLTVVPTISWGLAQSYEFCFEGVDPGSVVAVGMIGCKQSKHNFMRGYNEMLRRIKPSRILCFGSPFPEMDGDVIAIDYMASRKVVR